MVWGEEECRDVYCKLERKAVVACHLHYLSNSVGCCCNKTRISTCFCWRVTRDETEYSTLSWFPDYHISCLCSGMITHYQCCLDLDSASSLWSIVGMMSNNVWSAACWYRVFEPTYKCPTVAPKSLQRLFSSNNSLVLFELSCKSLSNHASGTLPTWLWACLLPPLLAHMRIKSWRTSHTQELPPVDASANGSVTSASFTPLSEHNTIWSYILFLQALR